jgi:hypothetical protein
MQIKAMQRASEPIALTFSIEDVPGIKAFNRDLVKLSFDRKLDGRTIGAINGIIANQLRAFIPQPGTQQNVNVVVSDPDVIIAGFVNSLPGPLRNAVIVWGQEQRRLRMAGPSQPSVVA